MITKCEQSAGAVPHPSAPLGATRPLCLVAFCHVTYLAVARGESLRSFNFCDVWRTLRIRLRASSESGLESRLRSVRSCTRNRPGRSSPRTTAPDLGFRYSVNPYRGCSHACNYCYARITHEYLGYGAGTDFESQLIVKVNATRASGEATSFSALERRQDCLEWRHGLATNPWKLSGNSRVAVCRCVGGTPIRW